MKADGCWVKAKDLMVGEFAIIHGFDGYMTHSFFEVIGHKHEEKIVVMKSGWDHGFTEEVHYDHLVRTRPEAPAIATEEFREQYPAYKRWPYDAEGNFTFTPLDWSEGKPKPIHNTCGSK